MTRPAPQPIGADHDWLKRTLRRAQDNAHLLYDGEVTFVDQLAERLRRFEDQTFVSLKQRAWLRRIDKRLDRHNVAPEGAREHVAPEGAREHVAPEGAREHVAPEGAREHVAPEGAREHSAAEPGDPDDPVARPVDEAMR